MSEMLSTRDRIIAAAEARMRDGGYHGFSFREVAADVGIKSASVHHHFPAKEDLASAVVDGYTERFIAALGDPTDQGRTPTALIDRYVELFRRALIDEKRMCLCGLLGSETRALPDRVSADTRTFFHHHIAWLSKVFRTDAPHESQTAIEDKAMRFVAALEGALLVAQSLGDADVFERIVGSTMATLDLGGSELN
jgi:TetR/AcrR family transcriptional repressor of nem operon